MQKKNSPIKKNPIFRVISKESSLLFCTLLVVILVSLTSLIVPIAFKIIVDSILVKEIEKAFFVVIGVTFFLILLRIPLIIFQDFCVVSLRQKIESNLLSRFFSSIKTADTYQINRYESAQLLNTMSNLVSNFQFLFVNLIYFIGYDFVVCIAAFTILWLADPVVFLVAIVLFFIQLIFYVVNSGNNDGLIRDYSNKKETLIQKIDEYLRCYSVISGAWLHKKFIKDFEASSLETCEKFAAKELIFVSDAFTQSYITLIGNFLLTSICALKVIQQEITMGELLMVLLMSGLIYAPIFRLGDAKYAISHLNIIFNELFSIIDLPRERQGNGLICDRISTIEFKNVSFSYDNKMILNNANAVFKKGFLYVINGASGIGKSTICKMIVRIYEPNSGVIAINQTDVMQFDIQSLRDHISYVSQADLVYPGAVKEIATSFSNNIDTDRLSAALLKSGVNNVFSEVIDLNEDKHMNSVSINKLSGGQRQRLTVARVFYEDRSVLIVDEPSSSLDIVNEENMFSALNNVKLDKIVIMISHRDSALKAADFTYTLRDGKFILLD